MQLRATGLRITAPRLAVLNAVAAKSHSDDDSVSAQVRLQLRSVSTPGRFTTCWTIYGAGLLRRASGFVRTVQENRGQPSPSRLPQLLTDRRYLFGDENYSSNQLRVARRDEIQLNLAYRTPTRSKSEIFEQLSGQVSVGPVCDIDEMYVEARIRTRIFSPNLRRNAMCFLLSQSMRKSGIP